MSATSRGARARVACQPSRRRPHTRARLTPPRTLTLDTAAFLGALALVTLAAAGAWSLAIVTWTVSTAGSAALAAAFLGAAAFLAGFALGPACGQRAGGSRRRVSATAAASERDGRGE